MDYLQFSNRKYKDQRIVKYLNNNAPIDPEETKQKIRPLFEQSKEFKKQQKLALQKSQLHKRQQELISQYSGKIRYRVLDAKKRIEIKEEYIEIGEKLKILEKQIVDHAKNTENIYRKLFKINAVYSAPGNAILLNNQKMKHWNKLIQNLKNGELLLEDGTVITKKQFEKERISNLSDDEKAYELQSGLAQKIRLATQMRNNLEIQKDLDALKKSQDWFAAEKEKLEELYK